MTIRFAAANPEYNPVVARMMGAPVRLRAANDNVLGICSDKLLKAALRHFAEHGLSAAEHARDLAERAFFAGEREQYRWWLSICRTLDRRMAEAAADQMAASALEATEIPAGNLA
jgi:hypothetical protein